MAEKWEEMPGNGHLKRHRAPTSGCQNVSCLVDGCRNDLSQCRDYHRRHKVCESHSKTPVVLVGGQEQRFCQQCSRFHLLIEFDDVKRSCRKRLDGHNRRRRKPISGNLLLNHHGAKLPNCAQMFPTPSTDSNCCTTIKGEDEALSSRQLALSNAVQPHPSQQCGSPSTWSFREGRQFPFLHRIDPAISSTSESRFSHSLDSDCALSLLSSSAQTQANMLSTLEYGNELSLDTMEADLRILHSEGDGGASSQSHLPFSWY